MKILHLTDLHLNQNYFKLNFEKTKQILINASQMGFDHLAITGDIAHNADDQSFALFRSLLKDFNLLDSKKASITIGNHDIFGGVYSVKDLVDFPNRCRVTDYQNKVDRFLNYFEELFVDCYFPSQRNIFPFVKIINEIAFIGINTNDRYSVLQNPFASNGKVDKESYNNLVKIFQLNKISDKDKIILAHHHFYKNNFEAKSSTSQLWDKIEGYTLKLRGKKKLLKLFKKNKVKYILHGHSHENKYYERMGINIYNSAGAIDNEYKNLAVINIFDTKTNMMINKESNINSNQEKQIVEMMY